MKKLIFFLGTFLGLAGSALPQTADTNSAAWLTQPLSLIGALNTALQQNAAILKGKNDLEASYGIVVQTRAIALPLVQATGKYADNEITTLQEPPIPASAIRRRTRIGTRACKSCNAFTTAGN